MKVKIADILTFYLCISVLIPPVVNIVVINLLIFLVLRNKKNYKIQMDFILLSLICYFIVVLLGAINAQDYERLATKVIGWLTAIEIYIFYKELSISIRARFEVTLLICGLICSLNSFLFYFDIKIGLIKFPDVNSTVFISLVAFIIIFFKHGILTHFFKLLFLIYLFISFILADSRSAMVVVVILFLINLKSIKSFLLATISLLVTYNIFYNMNILNFRSMIYKTVNLNYSSNILRYSMWEDIIHNIIPVHPILGVGSGNLLTVFHQYISLPRNLNHAHSIYFNTLAENGILGLLLIGSIVIKTIFDSIKEIYLNSNKKVLGICIITLWCFGISLTLINDSRLLFIVFAILGVFYQEEEKTND